jgi:hypothetical protein
MDTRRLSDRKALVANTEEPVDRSDLKSQMLGECHEPYIAAEYDCQGPEMWHRVLSASIQPPPSVVEAPVRRSPIEPEWPRKVYRRAREGPRSASHRQSKNGL